VQRFHWAQWPQLLDWCFQCIAQGKFRSLCPQTTSSTSHLKTGHPFLLEGTSTVHVICFQANFENFLQGKFGTLLVLNSIPSQFEIDQGKRPSCHQNDPRLDQPLCANGPPSSKLNLQLPWLRLDTAHDLHPAEKLQSSRAGEQMFPRYLQQNWP
jgi:hypothetical protein